MLSTKGNNNKHSGGFPHSEIHGSKLILSSPWLIAEYHVLHRLLLPRHPPNALIALDLIRKKKDQRSFPRMRPFVRAPACFRSMHVRFPPLPCSRDMFIQSNERWLVYLTWTTSLLASNPLLDWPPPHPHSGTANNADYLSERCKGMTCVMRASQQDEKKQTVLSDHVGNGGA